MYTWYPQLVCLYPVCLGVTAMNNIKQLEYLFRVHVMISVVHNGGSGECLQHLLAALGYVMLIWKVTLQEIIVSYVVSYLIRIFTPSWLVAV